ncbi:ABC transporter substrate-binding protein [Szabonella alba]|uniref:ABC transporter substrate-binding protein n=1 Tax=Szabonella alba TaxID=2804194 RepID=A0A8K0V9G8_9RHOB|nr:ABC transporter substrate-binding protein [Szabonella alba]MBL4916836.1 ABC transporter substrate-binding protein [Szabonella alba]
MFGFSRKATVLAGAMVLGLAAPVSAQDKGQVNVVCVLAEWCDAMRAPFEAATGYRMEFLNLRSNEALVRIRAESSNPTFDAYFAGTGDPHFVAAREGLTEYHDSPLKSELLPDLVSAVDGAYLPIYANPIAFAVNPQVLEQAGAPMPASWRDLANPAYKGLMGMADPNSSGTAYVVIATLVQLFGEEEAFDLLAAMHQNMASYTRSGSGALGPVGQGELGIGVIFMSSIVREIQNGFPIEIVLPEEGTGYEISGVSLVKNGPNPEGGRAFIDYVLSKEAQDLGEPTGNPQPKANMNATLPEGAPEMSKVNIIDYDFVTYGDPDLQSRLIGRWTSEIFPVPR